jgi:hypothetical protein
MVLEHVMLAKEIVNLQTWTSSRLILPLRESDSASMAMIELGWLPNEMAGGRAVDEVATKRLEKSMGWVHRG